MDKTAPICDQTAEQAVLAYVLRNPDTYRRLADIIRPDDFYFRPFAWVWEAMHELNERGLDIDALSVTDELQRMGRLAEFVMPGVPQFKGITAFSQVKDVHTSAAGETYAINIQDYAAKRKIDQWLTEAHTKAHNGRRAADLISDLESSFATLMLHSGKVRTHTANSTVAAATAFDASKNASHGNRDFPTGLKELDKILGIIRTELVTIAGRPGQGKSSLLQSITLNAAGVGRRVKFFSLEMGLTQVTQRFISQLCGISAYRIMQGRLAPDEWERYEQGRDQFCELPIILCDLPAISIGQIRTEARRDEIDAVVLDYVQLARADKRNDRRDLDIGEVTGGLKALAKELDIPVIMAAQMGRAVEARAEKIPTLADLRESGSIENDSDSVVFIYNKSDFDPYELRVEKHRNGPKGTAHVQFNKETMRFSETEIKLVDFNSD